MQYCSEKDRENKYQGRYFDDTSLHLVSVLINLIACFPSWSRHEETNLSSILHSKKMYCGVEAALSISLGTSIQFGPCPLWLMDGLHNAFNKQLFKEGVTTEDPGYDFRSYSKGSHHFFCSQICLIFWSWSQHLHGPLACFSHPGCWRWGCEFVTAVSLHKALKHQQSLKASSFLFVLGRVTERLEWRACCGWRQGHICQGESWLSTSLTCPLQWILVASLSLITSLPFSAFKKVGPWVTDENSTIYEQTIPYSNIPLDIGIC